MRITKEQSAENRVRILTAAERLFREHGIDAVSVADLMMAAGFTHGGFYNHFESKEELAAAACKHALDASRKPFVEALADGNGKAWEKYGQYYVSIEHRDHPEDGCTLGALAADAGRQEAIVQAAFAEHIEQILEAMTDNLGRASDGGPESELRERAIRKWNELVGALVLARAVALANPALSEELLAASRKHAGNP